MATPVTASLVALLLAHDVPDPMAVIAQTADKMPDSRRSQ